MQNNTVQTISYQSGVWGKRLTNVITEQPVNLTINNETWLTFMCTPNDLEALAIGFLYNEEIIEGIDTVASVRVCPAEDNIDVWLNQAVRKPDTWIRTSGCSGGETSVKKVRSPARDGRSSNGSLLSPERVGLLIQQLGAAQELYKKTGGVHTSALSDGESILTSVEDIGRHNTLDKLAGRCLLEKISFKKKIILTTGRVSSEMIQKAGRMKATMVISRTSPSSFSIPMADESGITLIGYARGERFTIYSHPERILSVEGEITISEVA